MSYVEVAHTADRAIQVKANNLPEFFSDAAQGMYSLMGISTGQINEVREFVTDQPDLESLLVWFLAELLVISELENLAATEFDLHFEDHQLKGSVKLAEILTKDSMIKAVTYSGLKVETRKDCLEAVIVFDF